MRGPRPLKLSLEVKRFRAREVTARLSTEQASCVIVTDDPFPATAQHWLETEQVLGVPQIQALVAASWMVAHGSSVGELCSDINYVITGGM